MKQRKQSRYVAAPGPDLDLDQDDVRDSKGARVDQAYIDEAVAEVHEQLRPGRPRRGEERGGEAPRMIVRLPVTLHAAVIERAEREGRSRSAVVREAIEEYFTS